MPRLPYLDAADLPNDYEVLAADADRLPEHIDVEWWNRKNNVRVFGHNPGLTRMHVTANVTLWTRSGLSPAEVEVVILAVAHELDSPFIWHHHIESALDRGLTVENVIALADGDIADLPEEYAVLAEYAAATVEDEVTDELHTQLATHYENRTVVGAAMLAAYYLFIHRCASALGVGLREAFYGWDLRDYPE
jgi:alkylhydroperoxidase family enzyme